MKDSRIRYRFSGRETADYRLFSVPMDLDNALPQSILEDDLGEYDDTRWRLFGVTGLGTNQSYVEFPNAGSFTPWKAFWLATTQSGVSIDTEAGAVRSLERTGILLRAGWNYVGLPFNHSIGLDQLSLLIRAGS